MQGVLQFFLVFALLLAFGSVFICGVYATTRGYYDTNISGDEEKYGFIFKNWYFFWYKKSTVKMWEQYKGQPLILLIDELRRLTGLQNIKMEPTRDALHAPVEFANHIPFIEAQKCVLFKGIGMSDTQPGADCYTIIKEKDNYIFPEWIRKVMAGCITCWGSIYGSLFFWAFHLLISNGIYLELYGWSDHPFLLLIATWFCYCFCLAYLNTVLWRKTNIH